jgi:hypothetical protein
MSEPLRVALVAEGPTDRTVIRSALKAVLGERPFVLNQLQPEESLAFGPLGTGWSGVYRWCKAAAKEGAGRLAGNALPFLLHDILVLHLDADVAGEKYSNGGIVKERRDGNLPCERDCPPVADTVNALRAVLLSWCGEKAVPPRVVICMPSKSTEAWVLAALFPRDLAMRGYIECYRDPEGRLGQQPAEKRIRKRTRDYQNHADEMTKAWPRLVSSGVLGEAGRFQQEFEAVASSLS